MKIADRYRIVLERFNDEMPWPHTELHYDNPFQLLVAVILSAQCTDKRINMVTPELFRAFPTAQKLAEAEPQELYEFIKSVSYPNNKTKALLGMAKALVERFDGPVPDNIDALTSLLGVGRKTANVILAVIYGQAAMAVDTHVFRVSERIGLTTNSKNPLPTERALMRHIPEELVPRAHLWLILHGRYICKARKPDCGNCYLCDVCRHYARLQKAAQTANPDKPAKAAKTTKAAKPAKSAKSVKAAKDDEQ